MPEGIPENLPPKKPGALRRITRVVKESFPWDPAGKKKRSIKPFPEDMVPGRSGRSRVRIIHSEEKNDFNTLPTLEQNIKASEQFIRALRNPNLYQDDSYDFRFVKSSLGYRVEKPSETGWFDLHSVLTTARERYKLPMAIYVGVDHHARLLLKGYYDTPEGKKLMAYNPFNSGFEEIDAKFDANGHTIGVLRNTSDVPLRREEINLMQVLESPERSEYRNLLTNIKVFGFQKEAINCIPYCLFVSAMLYGLEPGNTDFKTHGIKQFEQDFGVRIMTREEIVPPKTRVRIIG